jgi:hypothetical protein
MPKSKLRRKVAEKRAYKAEHQPEVLAPQKIESPKWLAPLMVAGFVIGLLWIVVFYISQTAYPVPGIGTWNMLIGFGFIGVGFVLATRWR